MSHPRGLVPKLLGLKCQFRGDWSQRKANPTSESDSTTFAGEEMQRHLSYYFFSLTTDINGVCQNPRVPAAERSMTITAPGVRAHCFFCFWLSVNSLSSPVNGYSGGRWPMANVGVHSYISTKRTSSFIKFCISHMQRCWARACFLVLASLMAATVDSSGSEHIFRVNIP